MFWRAETSKKALSLKPYVFRIREGYLVGVAMDAEEGAPCKHCVQKWMEARRVWIEPMEVSELVVRQDIVADLLVENNPHVLYEISDDGHVVRMECLVFPHPGCACEKTNYFAPEKLHKNTNYAFSPLYQITCTRFGTPEGNLWLTRATGDSVISGETITVHAVAREKEDSRQKAIDEWLKRSIESDLPIRLSCGEIVPSEVLQSGVTELFSPRMAEGAIGVMGAGKTRDEASLQALFELARLKTLKRYSQSMKNPMLVVGANNWIRSQVPFFLIQQYDLHLLFYPNSTQSWVVGLVAFSRQHADERPTFVFASHADIKKAIDELFCRILEVLRPEEAESGATVLKRPETKPISQKLTLWWTHWLYRCPKITLKDVLQLETYPLSVANWRSYFMDGQNKVSILAVNHPVLPSNLRVVVKLLADEPKETHQGTRITGIATWADFNGQQR